MHPHPALEFIQQMEAEDRRNVEAKQRALTLNDDATFLSPSWDNYTPYDLVPLYDAVCLVVGIKPDHVQFRGWCYEMEPHATGEAKKALSKFVLLHKFSLDSTTHGQLETTGFNKKLSLMRFSHWANANNIPLPPQFPHEAENTQPESVTPASFVLEVDSKGEVAPLSPPPSPSAHGSLIKPRRVQGYTQAVYDFLKIEFASHKQRPTAVEVLASWRATPPPGISEIGQRGFKYQDARGDWKEADLEKLRKVIERFWIK
jgi:hypothetical protein